MATRSKELDAWQRKREQDKGLKKRALATECVGQRTRKARKALKDVTNDTGAGGEEPAKLERRISFKDAEVEVEHQQSREMVAKLQRMLDTRKGEPVTTQVLRPFSKAEFVVETTLSSLADTGAQGTREARQMEGMEAERHQWAEEQAQSYTKHQKLEHVCVLLYSCFFVCLYVCVCVCVCVCATKTFFVLFLPFFCPPASIDAFYC
jgi:hypothetical protein